MKRMVASLLVVGVLLPFESAFGMSPMEEKWMKFTALTSAAVFITMAFTLVSGAVMSFLLLASMTFGKTLEKSMEISSSKNFKLAFLGLINTLGMAFLCIVLLALKNPLTILCGIAIFLSFLAISFLSLASASRRLGMRLLDGHALSKQRNICTALGWMVLSFCLLVPVIGWAIFLYQALMGLGSTMLALFQEEKKEERALQKLSVE